MMMYKTTSRKHYKVHKELLNSRCFYNLPVHCHYLCLFTALGHCRAIFFCDKRNLTFVSDAANLQKIIFDH